MQREPLKDDFVSDSVNILQYISLSLTYLAALVGSGSRSRLRKLWQCRSSYRRRRRHRRRRGRPRFVSNVVVLLY